MKLEKAWIIGIILVLLGFGYFYSPLLDSTVLAPLDTLVGLYHPFRDLYSPEFPNGIPYKNFLITDPVRQIIPWKELAMSMIKDSNLPLWNPYEMAGKPLLGNFQTSPFYPLNLILIISPFKYSWTAFIALQQILGFIFMYLYLKSLNFGKIVKILGAFIFSFSGFIVVWLEWGTLGHTYIYLPLLLFSIERIFQRGSVKYFLLYSLSLIFSHFAGHLQTFIYIYIFASFYFLLNFIDAVNKKDILKWFALANVFFLSVTVFQWLPTLEFLLLSARDIDQTVTQTGWFLPPQHLLQFVAPDFFGNPATLNYWGVWNYAEFLGYIGIIPFLFMLPTIGYRNKKIIFYQLAVLISLIFSTNNPLTSYLYTENIPFFTSAQPTRLISLVSFSLIVLSMYGIKKLSEESFKKTSLLPLALFIFLFITIWIVVTQNLFHINAENLEVTKRNIILPTLLLLAALFSFTFLIFTKKNIAVKNIILLFILIVTIFDLTRVAQKFNSFSSEEYFYPQTKIIEFLKKDKNKFRIATNDNRILAPNITTYYRIESVEGYDPLYLKDYAEFVSLLERQKPDISAPFGFNRIISPKNLESPLIDYLNVKYILSLTEITDPKYEFVFQEGETRVYENVDVLPRAFFIDTVEVARDDAHAAEILLNSDLRNVAVTTDPIENSKFGNGEVLISDYSENRIKISTINDSEAFLILSDTYYPTWRVKVNGFESKIYKVNLAFRGVIVPPGENEIIFYTKIF